jgi:hypothetical protein
MTINWKRGGKNWKDGPAYCGSAGTPVVKIKDWHVGGRCREALWLVEELISYEA